jgi:chromosome segregation ATPase
MSKSYSNFSTKQLRSEKTDLLQQISYYSEKLNEAEEQSKKIVDKSKELEEITSKYDLLKEGYAKLAELKAKEENKHQELLFELPKIEEKVKITEQLLLNVNRNGEQEVEKYKEIISKLQSKELKLSNDVKEVEKNLSLINNELNDKKIELDKVFKDNEYQKKQLDLLKAKEKDLKESIKQLESKIKEKISEFESILNEVINIKQDLETLKSEKVALIDEISEKQNKFTSEINLKEENLAKREAEVSKRELLLDSKKTDLMTAKKGLEKYLNKPLDIII